MFFDKMDTVTTLPHYKQLLLNLVQTLQANGSDVTFIVLPTLLGPMPGDVYMDKMLRDWKAQYGINYYDFTGTITDPTMFYNHDHLNTKGTAYVMHQFIKPIVDSLQTSSNK
jgi:hypothetical protein